PRQGRDASRPHPGTLRADRQPPADLPQTIMTIAERFVGVADAAVARGAEVLATVGLGSCVAILLHDARARVGGLAHVLLPAPHGTFVECDAARYATTAVPYLLREMVVKGASRARITARLVGGASLFAAARTE